jgi:glycosyltransferase involved in cell wall biosynthesis
MRIVFDWGVSSFFGWGVYGLNLALEWSKDPEIEASTLEPMAAAHISVDPLRRRALRSFVQRSSVPPPPGVFRLHALGNQFLHEADAPVGVIFFELPLEAAAIERAKRYQLIVTGSRWNEMLLREAGIDQVCTIYQGVDRTLFHPAPRRELFPGKFVIFSGGKAEPRKGQDLVVKAFRAFAQRHADVVLVTAWSSPWAGLAAGMDLDLSSVADRVVDVGAVPNAQMPQIYRECDVGLFPNRCEGGTNLVAMECLACGIPIIVSANSGHHDLVPFRGVTALRNQVQVDLGWESDIEEILAALEVAYRRRARLNWNPLFDFTWSRTARDLKTVVEKIYGRTSQAA